MAEYVIVTVKDSGVDLFNNCIHFFECVRRSRGFGQDFARCQSKLGIAKIRFIRWGEAVAINEYPRSGNNVLHRELGQVLAILEEIEQHLRTAQKLSKWHELYAKQDDLALFELGNMSAWALRDSNSFEELVGQITAFVGDLEKLCHVEATAPNLAELEDEEPEIKTSPLAVQGAAAGADSILSKAAAEKMSDTQNERLAEDDARERLSSYIVTQLEKMDDPNEDDEGDSSRPTWKKVRRVTQTTISQEEIKRQVRALERGAQSLVNKKAACGPAIQRQLELAQEGLSEADPAKRYCYELVQLEPQVRKLNERELQYIREVDKGKKRDRDGKSQSAYERVSVTAYFRRAPTLEQNCLRMLEEEERGQQPSILPPTLQVATQERDGGGDQHGPAADRTQFTTPDESVNSKYEEKSVRTLPETSVFDRDGRSRATCPTTIVTSQPRTKDGAKSNNPLVRSALATEMERKEEGESLKATRKDAIPGDDSSAIVDGENEGCGRDSDGDTTWTISSILDDAELYLQAFSDQLSRDLKVASDNPTASGPKYEYLEMALKAFAWKLHGESSNPFQWRTSKVIYRNRRKIVGLLSRTCTAPTVSVSGTESEDEEPERELFQTPVDRTSDWLSQVESSPTDGPLEEDSNSDFADEPVPFQFTDYEQFVRKSNAYKWLLSKMWQYDQLSYGSSDIMSEIGTRVQNELRTLEPFCQISGRKPSSIVTMAFSLDWNPMTILLGQESDLTLKDIFERVVCLTGTVHEAQATTVMEYMTQTWPETGEYILTLIKKLVSIPEGEECVYQLPESPLNQQDRLSDRVPAMNPNTPQLRAQINRPSNCSISAVGVPYFVSEIAEQVGWLAATLRCPPNAPRRGVVICTPKVKDLQITADETAAPAAAITGSCRIVFDFKQVNEKDDPVERNGLCWSPLFTRPILVSGYPILRRSEKNTGIEISLRHMACLVRSQEAVQWGERIIIKGFSSLLVATLATARTVVWHLIVSGSAEERISYVDPELDKLDLRMPKGFTLRDLEGSRHFVGWCANATDMCGCEGAALNVTTSGLPPYCPASTFIDKLHITVGSGVVGGVSMYVNKKEQPVWLERENDYPSLLNWVVVRPIVFYDVSDHRAWLVDSASALLHLVRISLHLDNPKFQTPSAYDWVFEASKLKDKWDGSTGYRAVLKTLMDEENLNLDLYVIGNSTINGQSVVEYAKFKTRVKKILHSIEILIDAQVKVASQDGVKIHHTLDPWKQKHITGFDVLDVISPLGPVHTRMQPIEARGTGWTDLLPEIGITTIFGKGFRNLILPDDPSGICSGWRSVPTGFDYLVASVSTLQMLRMWPLARMEPGLEVGELTKKVVWLSSSDPLQPCPCVGTPGARHVSPVQFFMPKKSWGGKLTSRHMKPIDILGLGQQGAVIFGHMAQQGYAKGGNDSAKEEQESDQCELSVVHSVSSHTTGGPSTADSTAGSSISHPSTITVPSAEAFIDIYEEGESSKDKSGKRTKPLRKLRKFMRKWIEGASARIVDFITQGQGIGVSLLRKDTLRR